MEKNVKITSKGIQNILRNYSSSLSFVEYIWNGFDATADTIYINYTYNEFDVIDSIEVIDNGYGIDFDLIKSKFNPFHESEKAIKITSPKHTSVMHGKNGVGRLSFFTFADSAKWISTYKNDDILKSCTIKIEANILNSYDDNLEDTLVSENTGTIVRFTNIFISRQEFENEILPFLVTEFCWYLELEKHVKKSIFINGSELDYRNNIIESDSFQILHEKSDTLFNVNYIQWDNKLHKEFSKYYFIDSQNREVFKDYTTLNKKGDEFYHSIFIQSSFFDDFDSKNQQSTTQLLLFGKAKTSTEYKYLIKEINNYLHSKRKLHLHKFAYRLFDKYEKDGILPVYQNEWEEKFKKPQLKDVITSLYESEPKLFNNLNIEQKKTFVRFLDLILDSNEREKTFKILDEVIKLTPAEREDFEKLFRTTSLNKITNTIKLIEDRYRTFYKLKDLVFNPALKANEVNHLQKVIESHYWFFGEQYHLVTAAEPKIREALRRFKHLLYKTDENRYIDHQHKLREMDIFACRQNKTVDRIDNIVIELKHPNIRLGAKEYNQVYNYLDVILKQPEFNAPNMFWEFYLIGNKFDSSDYIQNHIKSNKNHGIPSLMLTLKEGRVKVFAKTWSEIFTEFEIKHDFLDQKLKLERQELFNELETANDVVKSLESNSAIQPKEVQIDS